MGGQPAAQSKQQSVAGDDRELAEILRHLEASADSGQWVDKRAHERKKIALRCVVYHIFSANGTVRATAGQTRDLSVGGAGFLTREHFRRSDPVVIVLTLPGGGSKRVTGSIVYSRLVRTGWYLTGVKFESISDERLLEPPPTTGAAPEPAAKSPAPSEPHPAPAADSAPALSPRDQALRLLNEGSSGWRMSAEKIAKVLDYSRSADPVVRRATIPVLMQIGGVKAAEALRTLLDDSNPEIQAEAADAAGHLKVADAKEQLAGLLQSKTELVALSAAEALGRLGDQRGLRLVAQYVMSERTLNRRAARALGVIVGQEFRPTSEGLAAARSYIKQKKIKV